MNPGGGAAVAALAPAPGGCLPLGANKSPGPTELASPTRSARAGPSPAQFAPVRRQCEAISQVQVEEMNTLGEKVMWNFRHLSRCCHA